MTLRNPQPDPLFTDLPTLRKMMDRTLSLGQPDLRRAGWALGLLGAHWAVLRVVRAGRNLDDLLFSRYRQRRIEAPIFIVATPRSGTTFLHHLMSLDPQFNHLKLYHTLLPSVSLIRAVHAIERIDEALGGPLRAMLGTLERAAFGGWEGIHDIGFARPEEDEGLFVLTLLTPALYLLLHEIDEVPEVGYVDGICEETRRRLVDYYRDSVQRILEAERAEGTLLEKSVLIGGRLQTMREAYPDARFIHLVRHPYRSIASFVSMFCKPWRAVSPSLALDGPGTRRLAELAIEYYRRLHRARAEMGLDKMITVRFDDLVADPMRTLDRIYAWLDRPVEAPFRDAVTAALERPERHRSSHDYSLEHFGLTRAFIADELSEIFDTHGFAA